MKLYEINSDVMHGFKRYTKREAEKTFLTRLKPEKYFFRKDIKYYIYSKSIMSQTLIPRGPLLQCKPLFIT